MILPTLTLAFATTAVVIRVVRASMVEVLAEPFVTTARAKGLHPRLVARRHVLRAALIPTITIVGINTGYLLSGAVVVERIFSLPGLGRYALEGIPAATTGRPGRDHRRRVPVRRHEPGHGRGLRVRRSADQVLTSRGSRVEGRGSRVRRRADG
jgi:hypothetical protein